MSTIDQDFVEFIVKSLVGNPDKVVINRRIDEKGVLIELTVAQEDLGRVIGKRGATAQSIRTLLRALGTKNDARYNLKIVDPEQEEKSSDEAPAQTEEDTSHEDEEVEEPEDEEEQDELEDDDDEDEDDDDDEEEEEEDESLADKTRKELEELDDLDI